MKEEKTRRTLYFERYGHYPPVIIDYPEDPAMVKRLAKAFEKYTSDPEFQKNVAKAMRALNRKS